MEQRGLLMPDTFTATEVTATPVWLDAFVCQYQLTDTTSCPETIFNVNRSRRWNESATTGGMDLYTRDSDQLHFTPEGPPVEHEPILAFAQECLDDYVKKHKAAGAVPSFGFTEGYSVLRYKPGQAYHGVHSDRGEGTGMTSNRHLTFSMFLNTCPSGGELEYPAQGIKVAPVEGRAVIFPAAWTHSHRSLPTTVDRYVFNIFYGFFRAS
ncbi:MAG: hypothetical protein CL489_03000 [Acidobacteria bacterium]|nr:hypothetical protein [Acidobacteriota bacterium]